MKFQVQLFLDGEVNEVYIYDYNQTDCNKKLWPSVTVLMEKGQRWAHVFVYPLGLPC